jgi:hypothetical protein
MAVSFDKLLDAYLFVSMSGADRNEAFVCLASGEIYYRTELLDEDEQELPDDIDDGEKYLRVPDKRELDLGKPLVLAFTREFLPDDYGRVRNIFGGRGAYASFKGCSPAGGSSSNGMNSNRRPKKRHCGNGAVSIR